MSLHKQRISLPSGIINGPMQQLAIDFQSAQTTATEMLRRARVGDGDTPNPIAIAKKIGVPVLSTPPQFMVGRLGDVATVDGKHRIYVRRGVGGPHLAFTVAHELGHVAARTCELPIEQEERFANFFAGALLMPADRFRSAWTGNLRESIATWNHLPETAVALRASAFELGLVDLAITQNDEVRYWRSSRLGTPADIVGVGMAASRSGRASGPGLRARRLRDVRGRAVVIWNEAA